MVSADIAEQTAAAIANLKPASVQPGLLEPVDKKGQPTQQKPKAQEKREKPQPSKLQKEVEAEQAAASAKFDKAFARVAAPVEEDDEPDEIVKAQLAEDEEPEAVEAQPAKAKASAATAEDEEKKAEFRARLRLDGFDTEMLEGLTDAQIERLAQKRAPIQKDVSTKLEELARLKSGQTATEQQPVKGTPATTSQAFDAKAMAKQFRDAVLGDDEHGLEMTLGALTAHQQAQLDARIETEAAKIAPLASAFAELWTERSRTRLARTFPELEEDDNWNALLEKCTRRVSEKKIVLSTYQDIDGLYSDQAHITYGSRAKDNAVKAAARAARNKGQMAPSSRAERPTEQSAHDIFGELAAARERGDDDEIARLQKLARRANR